MTKSDLIKALSKRLGLTVKKSKLAVNTVFDSMANALADEGRVEIRDFFVMCTKHYEPYTSINPRTQEVVEVTQKRLAVFKCSEKLRKKVDYSEQIEMRDDTMKEKPGTPASRKKQALESVPEEFRPIYKQLVSEYQFHCIQRHGRPFVSYLILADLINDGWRPTHESFVEMQFDQDEKNKKSK